MEGSWDGAGGGRKAAHCHGYQQLRKVLPIHLVSFAALSSGGGNIPWRFWPRQTAWRVGGGGWEVGDGHAVPPAPGTEPGVGAHRLTSCPSVSCSATEWLDRDALPVVGFLSSRACEKGCHILDRELQGEKSRAWASRVGSQALPRWTAPSSQREPRSCPKQTHSCLGGPGSGQSRAPGSACRAPERESLPANQFWK